MTKSMFYIFNLFILEKKVHTTLSNVTEQKQKTKKNLWKQFSTKLLNFRSS